MASTASAICYDVNAQATLKFAVAGNAPEDSLMGSPFLYKGEPDGTEKGAVASFTTTYSEDLKSATIKIDAGSWDLDYIALKAGNGYVFWELTGWDPTKYDCLIIDNDQIFNTTKFKLNKPNNNNKDNNDNTPNPREISHLNLYGGAIAVPDSGATLSLLGLGLLGVAAASRAQRRKA